MRKEFALAIEQIAQTNPKVVFLTGDLGFMALEKVAAELKNRFINCGVAEQNMVSVAAGLSRSGFFPFIYSIAPFVVLRAFEQIRNDIGFHSLPACIVGNGGGYGYGIMGSSHHLLEDIACFRALRTFDIYTPSFTSDISQVIPKIISENKSCYLRLNLGVTTPEHCLTYAPIRQLQKGDQITLIYLGPLIRTWINQKKESLASIFHNADVFTISHIDNNFRNSLQTIINSVKKTSNVIIIEEHAEAGGVGEFISKILLEENIYPKNFRHLFAKGYPSATYGDQEFHLNENHLLANDLNSIVSSFKELNIG